MKPSIPNSYYSLMIKRAKGFLPEMEHARHTARILSPLIRNRYKLLDTGCCSGHLYRSFEKKMSYIEYYGLDSDRRFINEGKSIFKNYRNVHFERGDINKIPFKKNSFDIVLALNYLQNLPEIKSPLQNLIKVAKRFILLRLLIYEKGYLIQELDQLDKPSYYLNIYTPRQIKKIFKTFNKKSTVRFIDDYFIPKNIDKKYGDINKTKIIGGKQVSGSIILPWKFVLIKIL